MKTKYALAAGLISTLLMSGGTALAQTSPPSQPVLPAIATYPSVPQNFDPLTASDADLARYGFPPRPSGGPALSAWTDAMKSFKGFVQIQYGTSDFHSDFVTAPSQDSTTNGVSGTKPGTSSNWAGYSDYNTTGNNFTDVEATFTVPTISSSSPTPSDYSSWDGFGGTNFTGHTTNGLMQAGIHVEKRSSGVSAYPWWEIYPYNNEVPISGLTINTGNTVYVDCSYTTANGGTFSYYIENKTTGKAIPVQPVTGMAGYYDGTEADWITERPKVNGVQNPLGDFGSIDFSSCSTNNSANQHNGFADATDYQLWSWELTSDGSPTGKELANPGPVNGSTVGFTNYWYASS